jgi:hypothetical protein
MEFIDLGGVHVNFDEKTAKRTATAGLAIGQSGGRTDEKPQTATAHAYTSRMTQENATGNEENRGAAQLGDVRPPRSGDETTRREEEARNTYQSAREAYRQRREAIAAKAAQLRGDAQDPAHRARTGGAKQERRSSAFGRDGFPRRGELEDGAFGYTGEGVDRLHDATNRFDARYEEVRRKAAELKARIGNEAHMAKEEAKQSLREIVNKIKD